LLAAFLSLILSEDTSLSNWAKERSIFRVSLPIEVEVSNAWVIETKLHPHFSNSFIMLWKSMMERENLSILYTKIVWMRPFRISPSRSSSPGRFIVPPDMPPSVYVL